MGRPLKKKLYQDPAAAGPQFDEVDAWIPGEGAAEKCYTTRQAGSYKFVCFGKSSSSEGICRLVDKAPGALAEGEMIMTCTPFGESQENIKSLTKHKIKTFENKTYEWDPIDTARFAGQALIDQKVDEGNIDHKLYVDVVIPTDNATIPFYGHTRTFANIIDSYITPERIDIPNNPNAFIFSLNTSNDATIAIACANVVDAALLAGSTIEITVDGVTLSLPFAFADPVQTVAAWGILAPTAPALAMRSLFAKYSNREMDITVEFIPA